MRYYRPETRAEGLEILARYGPGAKVLVGGTDLYVGLRHHLIAPEALVDIKHMTDLPDPFTSDEESVTIGPTLTMAALSREPRVRSWFPGLVEAADLVGSIAIRNRASLVGNSCNGSPAGDTPPVLVAHEGSVTIESSDGERSVPIRDFFLGPRRTLCGPGELVVSIRIAKPKAGASSAFQRMTRRRGVDLATVSVAAHVDADDHVWLGLGAVGPVTLHARSDGPMPLGSPQAMTDAVERLLEVATPISDVRASALYRADMLRVLTKRAVMTAASRRQQEVLTA